MERLIDAEEAYKVLTDYYHQRTEIQHRALKEAIGRVPSVDAAEVVRCKDCKFYWKNSVMTNVPMCLASPRDDAFCSEGVRKDETD